MAGEVQRANLFADVDELMEWKRSFQIKQDELVTWQALVTENLQIMRERLNAASIRLDIVNKRLRRLEQEL